MAGSFGHRSQLMFHGSIVALLTPFEASGEIDFQALKKLIDFHLEAGTHALVVAGTTGESATLESSEYSALLEAVIRHVDGKIPVIAGSGAASTKHAVALSQEAESMGAAAVLVVTPYYNRPTQSGLIAHYGMIADAISIPVILYNVPSRTSVDLQPETVAVLAGHPNIVALKEAVPDINRIRSLVETCPPDFVILSGDDQTCLAAIRAGARGVVSVAANVAPVHMARLCLAGLAGDWASASKMDESLKSLYESLALETNPIPVKWAAFEMGLIGPDLRLPLTTLGQKHRQSVVECLKNLQIPLRETGSE